MNEGVIGKSRNRVDKFLLPPSSSSTWPVGSRYACLVGRGRHSLGANLGACGAHTRAEGGPRGFGTDEVSSSNSGQASVSSFGRLVAGAAGAAAAAARGRRGVGGGGGLCSRRDDLVHRRGWRRAAAQIAHVNRKEVGPFGAPRAAHATCFLAEVGGRGRERERERDRERLF